MVVTSFWEVLYCSRILGKFYRTFIFPSNLWFHRGNMAIVKRNGWISLKFSTPRIISSKSKQIIREIVALTNYRYQQNRVFSLWYAKFRLRCENETTRARYYEYRDNGTISRDPFREISAESDYRAPLDTSRVQLHLMENQPRRRRVSPEVEHETRELRARSGISLLQRRVKVSVIDSFSPVLLVKQRRPILGDSGWKWPSLVLV